MEECDYLCHKHECMVHCIVYCNKCSYCEKNKGVVCETYQGYY